MQSQRESVRRTDVLLRTKRPELETEIYELAPFEHVIFVPAKQLNVEDYKEIFNSQIRQATDVVSLSNIIPNNAVRIANIRDSELGDNLKGLFLTQADLEMVISGTFPEAPIVTGTKHGEHPNFIVYFEQTISDILAAKLCNFLEEILVGFNVIISQKEKSSENTPASTAGTRDVLRIKPLVTRKNIPDFLSCDEQWWFENLGNLYSGRITPSSFDIKKNAGHACFIHATSFPNIDLRQALLAFDTIYLDPPFWDTPNQDIPVFWQSQEIKQDDLLTLIEADRVRLVCSHEEERYDLGFLREAFEANPKGVIGRRRIAALMIADIVEMDNEYIFSRPEFKEHINRIICSIAESENVPIEEVSKSVLYPSYLRRGSFLPFMTRGLMGLMPLSQGKLFSEAYERVHNKNVELEAQTFSYYIQIAHTLDAIYIPHLSSNNYAESWLDIMRLLGDRLNFYRSFNTRIAAAWVSNEDEKLKRDETVLPPIPLVNFNEHAPIEDIINFTSHASSREKGYALISRLAELPLDQRSEEINELKKELYKHFSNNDFKESGFKWLDATAGVAAYALGINIPPFLAGINLVECILNTARGLSKMDPLLEMVDEATSDIIKRNEDIHFLAKISRVAEISDKLKN